MNQILPCARDERSYVEASMVAIKTICTILGLCVACSRAAPSNPTLISRLLSQEDNDIKIPVRRSYDISSRRLHGETISRLLNGPVLKEQLRTIKVNDGKVPSRITPEANSEDTVQVSPNVHSDYLHIENYIPTFITIPCASSSCDRQSPAGENIPPANSVYPEQAPSYDIADYFYVISETPTLIPLNPASTDHSLPSINADISPLHTSDDSLTDTEFSQILQSEIHNLPLTDSEHHIVVSELPLIPSPHSEFHESYYDAVSDEIAKDILDSEYNNVSEFTPHPHHSMTVNDEILAHGIETNEPLGPQIPFESTVLLPEAPAYFPLKPSFIEAIGHTEDDEITSSLDTYKPLHTITISDTSTPTFESKPIFVIPEAPVLLPLYSSNNTHSLLENTSSYNYIEKVNDSDKFNSKESSTDEEKIETTNPSLNPASPAEPIISIPEPPIYFPPNLPYANTEQNVKPPPIVSLPTVYISQAPQLLPMSPPNITFGSSTESPKTQELTHVIDHAHSITLDDSPNLLNYHYIKEQNEKTLETTESPTSSSYFETTSLQNDLIQNPESSELNPPNPFQHSIVSLDNFSYNQNANNEVTYFDNENKGGSVDSTKIPEAPQLFPLNPPSIIFSSSADSKVQESTQVIYSDYLDSFHPEIVTESDDLVERPYVVIPPSPTLMPLHSVSENINSIVDGNQQINFNFTNENYISNTPTIDHSHSITLDDSPNLLNLHYINEQNDKVLETTESSTSSFSFDTISLQNDFIIHIPEAPELNPANPSEYSIVSLDNSLHNQNTNDEVSYYGNENIGGYVDSTTKIPEAPQPFNQPHTSPSYNLTTTLNNSVENEEYQSENTVYNTSGLEIAKDEISANSYPTHKESEIKPENSPLNILVSTNQKMTLPQIMQNSNVIVVSNNHNEIQGQKEHFISSSTETSSSRYEESAPLSIVQDSNIVVSSSPIILEKTNEIVSQLNSTIQNLKLHNKNMQIQRNFKDLPPCDSEKPTDGVMTNVFEPKKCKVEGDHLKANLSSNQSNNYSRRRKVVIRRRKSKVTSNN